TTDQVKAAILSSQEYLQNHGGGTLDGYFAALYNDVLGRPAGPGEVQGWVQLQSTHHFARNTLASAFLTSPEGNQFLVQSFYQQFLQRPADPEGLNGFVQARTQGATEEVVIAAFLA